MAQWHTLSASEAQEELRTDLRIGLSEAEAKSRLVSFGKNVLPEGKSDSLFGIFLRQFQSPLIYILLIASATVFLTGEIIDGFIILFVIVFNSIIGTIQEGRAQNTISALKKFINTPAVVVREGEEKIVEDIGVVPGDVIVLQEGEKIPADARIFESHNLRLDEAAFTGESGPIHKSEEVLSKRDAISAEQVNMVFKGTHVVGGNGKAVVVATGKNSLIGKISQAIETIDSDIPLKADIERLSRAIVFVVLGATTMLFLLGLYLEKPFREMFATAVSLTVSIIPEGLPIVLTLVLASGVWRMAKRNALVKRLQAVEALGQAQVIAVDKTGTLTKNEMIVREIYIGGKIFEAEGDGYNPSGKIKLEGLAVYPLNHPELVLAGKIAAFTSNSRVMFVKESAVWRVAGDPTEAALLVFSEKIGFQKQELEKESPLVGEKPFDYATRCHIGSHRVEERFLQKKKKGSRQFVSIVGAPEAILSKAKRIFSIPPGEEETLGDIEILGRAQKEEIERIAAKMLSRGMRVIAFGFEEIDLNADFASIKPEDFVFAGLFGMSDSLRPEAKDAARQAEEAGVRVVMITGDHKITATAVAKEAGIYHTGDRILTGEELRELHEQDLEKALNNTTVFARVSPEDKMKIIRAYKRRGEIIAMTGDGVNDAPSLVAADLGVAMGKIGTEVAKEAADIILLDDNFGSIISAIEEGRNIYRNIKKVILYLFSTSVGEFFTIAGAIIAGYPLPILPAQILWLNLVTDGFLDVALAMEPKEENLLKKKFARSEKYLIDKSMLARIPLMALAMMIGTLFLFTTAYEHDIAKAWTISLTTLAIFQWFNAWNCRSEDRSIFRMNPFSNKFLIGATGIVIGLQFFAVYAPVMNYLLKTVPLHASEWILSSAVAFSIVLAEEGRKFIYRRIRG